MTAPDDIHTAFLTNLAALTSRLELGDVSAKSVVRLTGGASQETWAFEAATDGCTTPLILRRLANDASHLVDSIGPEAEACLMRRAGETGVPTPAVRHILTPQDKLGRGFISDRVAGETLAYRILHDETLATARAQLAFLCGEALARIHAIDVSSIPPLPTKFGRAKVDDLFDRYRAFGARSAIFEATFRWLNDNMVSNCGSARLLHGDFRHGNLIVGPDGLRAVLDWELAHLGDPAEDLGWITVNSWRFGSIDQPVGGFGTVEQMLEGYRSAGGDPIDVGRIRFWRALGSLAWGIGCRNMAEPHQSGANVTVERTMIGRRFSEAELDLLDILAPETAS